MSDDDDDDEFDFDVEMPLFEIDEIVILHPVDDVYKHYRGMEALVISIVRGELFGSQEDSGWCYVTDIPCPPPVSLPMPDMYYVWSEADFRKKENGAGMDFAKLMDRLRDPPRMREVDRQCTDGEYPL